MPFAQVGRFFGFIVVCVFTALLALSASGGAFAALGMPSGITEQAELIEMTYLVYTAAATVVFVGVVAVILYCVVRFRRKSPDDPLPPQTHGSTLVEVIWIAVPAVLTLSLFTLSFVVLLEVEDPAEPEALSVDVKGFRWQWQFTYDLDDLGEGQAPEGVQPGSKIDILGTPANEPTLVVPAGEEVEFLLHADDVIHSFYVHDFNYKLDVVPGRLNKFRVNLNEDAIGEHIAQCAEFCGRDHAIMRFTLKVVSREEFDQFISDQAAAAGLIDPDTRAVANADSE